MARPFSSGRPADGEFAAYAKADIDYVAGDDAAEILERQARETLSLLERVDERIAGTFVYAPGKWTMKQVVGHLSDDERIFAYRALCVARNDPAPLPGFDEKDYVRFAGFEDRSWTDLLGEFRVVRDATLALCRGLTPEAWLRRGIVNGYAASVRGLLFHVAGHELHHVRILRAKYLGGAS